MLTGKEIKSTQSSCKVRLRIHELQLIFNPKDGDKSAPPVSKKGDHSNLNLRLSGVDGELGEHFLFCGIVATVTRLCLS